MSELKVFSSERIYWAVEQVERVAGDIDTLHLDDSQFYLKSEVDVVLGEKDAEIARLDDLAHAHNIELLRKENSIEELEESHKREVEQLLMEIVKLKGRLSLLAEKFKANSTAQQGKEEEL